MKNTRYFIIIIILFSNLCWTGQSCSETIERVVAFIDNDVITLRELDQRFTILYIKDMTITKEMVLNTMVNQLLLEKDAIKRRITSNSREETIIKYINIYVRSLIRIDNDDIIGYYNENINILKNENIEDIRADIEKILIEKQVNTRVWELINDLKSKSYVKIQLIESHKTD